MRESWYTDVIWTLSTRWSWRFDLSVNVMNYQLDSILVALTGHPNAMAQSLQTDQRSSEVRQNMKDESLSPSSSIHYLLRRMILSIAVSTLWISHALHHVFIRAHHQIRTALVEDETKTVDVCKVWRYLFDMPGHPKKKQLPRSLIKPQ